MLDEFSKHPSDVAKSAAEYLKTVEVSDKTKRIYIDVLSLFLESLLSDPTDVTKSADGEYLLSSNWEDYYGGVFSNFIDWWMPRKVMGADTLHTRAPGILRKWVTWCYQKGCFEKERYQDFLEALPRGKVKEIDRLQKAGDLLFLLHTPNPGAWMTDDHEKIVSIAQRRRPDEWKEGYMKVSRFEKNAVFIEALEGGTVGPVMLSKELVSALKTGDVMNVTVGRFGKKWKVLESGNVYAEGTIF